MGKKSTRRYSQKFKSTVVLEVLKSEKSDAQVVRAFDVHPATLSRSKQAFLEKGPEVFGGSEEAEGHLNRIADWNPGPLDVLSTDFTELRYAGDAHVLWAVGT